MVTDWEAVIGFLFNCVPLHHPRNDYGVHTGSKEVGTTHQ